MPDMSVDPSHILSALTGLHDLNRRGRATVRQKTDNLFPFSYL